MNARKVVAWNLRHFRVERMKMTIDELAVDAGVDASFVARVERGVVNSSIDVLERLADALRIRVVQLFIEPAPGAPKPKAMAPGRRPSKSAKPKAAS